MSKINSVVHYGYTDNGNRYVKSTKGKKIGAAVGAAGFPVLFAAAINSEKYFDGTFGWLIKVAPKKALDVLPDGMKNAETGKEYFKSLIKDFSFPRLGKPLTIAYFGALFGICLGLSSLLGRGIGSAVDKIKNNIAIKKADKIDEEM